MPPVVAQPRRYSSNTNNNPGGVPVLSLGLDRPKSSDPLLSLGVQHHEHERDEQMMPAQSSTPVRNTNLNEISGAVHVDSEHELQSSSFALKRTRSMGVFDDYISPVKDLAGNYEDYPHLRVSDSLKESSHQERASSPQLPPVRPELAKQYSAPAVLSPQPTGTQFTPSPQASTSSSQTSSAHTSPYSAAAATPTKSSNDEYTSTYVHSDTSSPSIPGTPELTAPSDDSVLHHEPQRHVDYLSHDWKESDISSSWRYIVLRRKDVANSARLENASWRTWTKAKYNLKTVAPETVNWLKDYDVTWLYGPLYTEPQQHSSFYRSREAEDAAHKRGPTLGSSPAKPASPISPITTSSSSSTKPILKKKSAAETILSRPSPLTNGTQKRHPHSHPPHPENPDNETLSIYMRHHNYRHRPTEASTEDVSSYVNKQYVSSVGSPPLVSTTSSPSVQSSDTASVKSFASLSIPQGSTIKRIHFNNRVEQCIAVDEFAEEDEESSTDSDTDEDNDDQVHDRRDYSEDDEDDDDDDEEDEEEAGLFLMVRSQSSTSLHNPGLNGLASKNNPHRTIALLPATTLKYELEVSDREAREAAEASSVAYAMSHNTVNRRQVYKTYDYNSVYTSPQPSPSHSPSPSLSASPSVTVSPPLSTKSSSTNQTTTAVVKGEMAPKTLGSPSASSVLLGSNNSNSPNGGKTEDTSKIKDLAQSLWTNGWKR